MNWYFTDFTLWSKIQTGFHLLDWLRSPFITRSIYSHFFNNRNVFIVIFFFRFKKKKKNAIFTVICMKIQTSASVLTLSLSLSSLVLSIRLWLHAATHYCVCHDLHSRHTYRDDYSRGSGINRCSLCTILTISVSLSNTENGDVHMSLNKTVSLLPSSLFPWWADKHVSFTWSQSV